MPANPQPENQNPQNPQPENKEDGQKQDETNKTEEKADAVEKTDETDKAEDEVVKTIEIPTASKNAQVSVVVTENADGEITSAKATVDITVSGQKAVLSGSVVNKINATTGTDTDILVRVEDKKGKLLYKVTVSSEDLVSGKNLYVYQYNEKTGEYVVVNAKKYKVDEKGSVSISMSKKATYALINSKEAKAIDKQILSTVKAKKSTAKVTLKNGKTKTIKMKITVK